MPVYNAEKYLEEAIESILNQTFNNYEFIIINDGSQDSSEKIIKKFKDSRIKYIKNEKNMGLIYTLNKGIDLCNGEYIARMDSDDICHPRRLEEQISYLEKNEETDICGTSYIKFGEKIREKTIKMPISNEEIKVQVLFSSPICHPSVVVRKKVFKNIKFEEYYRGMEDYRLWSKLILTSKFYNIDKELINYRVTETGITQTSEKYTVVMMERFKTLIKELFESLNFILSEDELNLYSIIQNNQGIITEYKDDTINNYILLSKKIIEQNRKINYCDENLLKERFGKNLIKIYWLNRKKIKINNIILEWNILFYYGVKYCIKNYKFF